MFDKLARLSLLSKVQNIGVYNKAFNTNLPVLLQVIDKTETGYLLRLGSNVIDAKSVEYLIIGSKYWGVLNENKPPSYLIIHHAENLWRSDNLQIIKVCIFNVTIVP